MLPLRLEFLCRLTGTTAPPIEVGSTPSGIRRVFPIKDGTIEGPKLRGKVLPGGADYMLVRSDGAVLPDVRLTFETDDGALVMMQYNGLRHGPAEVMERLARGDSVEASEYYFRIAPRFETASTRYAWLNRILAVGSGHRMADGPIYDIYEIL